MAPTTPAAEDTPSRSSLARLATHIARHTPADGGFPLAVPGTTAIRFSRPTAIPMRAIVGPSICVVAQGAKVTLLGRDVLEYDTSRFLVVSVRLPIAGQVSKATRAEPFLAFKIDLDPYRVTELALRVFAHGPRKTAKGRGMYVGRTTGGIVDATVRLMEVMDDPTAAKLLAPLIIDEILIRLLCSPIGGRIAEMGLADSRLRRVSKAVSWLHDNFAAPVAVDALARLVHMSASSFHQHFRAVTSMSPLQYQKALRLQEARRLLLSGNYDAATAGRMAGYSSPSQFSREYVRFFGAPPARDIADLRRTGTRLTAAAPRAPQKVR